MPTATLKYKLSGYTAESITIIKNTNQQVYYSSSTGEPSDWSHATINSITFTPNRIKGINYSSTLRIYIDTTQIAHCSLGVGSYFPTDAVSISSSLWEKVKAHEKFTVYPQRSQTSGNRVAEMWTADEHTFTIDYTDNTGSCTPPTSTSLDTTNNVLTMTGGAGGTYNAFTGYGVSSAERTLGESTWGDWSDDTFVSGTTLSVSVSAGKEKKFRVRSQGEAGSAYYSSYVEVSGTITGNSGTGTVAVVFPQSDGKTGLQAAKVKLNIEADPDGDTMAVYRSIDSGTPESIGTSTGGTLIDTLPAGTGSRSVSYYVTDGTHTSTSASVTVQQETLSWNRTIATGTIISNASGSVSHQADITEMKNATARRAAYYGISFTLPGTIGRFGDWKSQMQTMQTVIGQCYTAAGLTAPTWETAPVYPKASVINQIRTALEAI